MACPAPFWYLIHDAFTEIPTKLEMSQPKKLEISERFLLVRRRMGLSQSEFGKLLGVSDEYISQIEGGRPPGKPLLKLFEVLEQNPIKSKSSYKITSDPLTLRERPADPVPHPTSDDCVGYLKFFLERCSDDAGKIAWTYYELKRCLPEDKWGAEDPFSSLSLEEAQALLDRIENEADRRIAEARLRARFGSQLPSKLKRPSSSSPATRKKTDP